VESPSEVLCPSPPRISFSDILGQGKEATIDLTEIGRLGKEDKRSDCGVNTSGVSEEDGGGRNELGSTNCAQKS